MSARAYVRRLVPTIWVCQACKDTSRIIIRVDQEDFAGKGEISPLYTPKRERDLQIERESLRAGIESATRLFYRTKTPLVALLH